MKVLYIANPLEKWPAGKETTGIMVQEASRRGARTYVCCHKDIAVAGPDPQALVTEIKPKQGEWGFEKLHQSRLDLSSFDVIHMRTDPPFDLSYYFVTLVLQMAAKHSLVVNDPVALRGLNEKLACLAFPDLIPESLVSSDLNEITQFVESIGGRAVLKPLYRCSGQGMALLQGASGQISTLVKEALHKEQGHVLIQRYIPGITKGETRLTVIGGRVAGVMRKVPKEGSFLSNLSFGASVEKCELTKRDLEITERLAPFLRQHGIHLAAVDLIDGYLSEINITSPGLLVEMNELNGSRLEVELEDWIEGLLKAR